MKFLSALLLAAAGTAIAADAAADMSGMDMKNGMDMSAMSKGGHKKGNSTSTKSQCNKMFRLEELEKLAANDTLLATVTKNNATRASDIKAKASKAAAELKTLQDNSTLVTVCGQMAAVRHEKRQCATMHRLERLEKIAGNATALNATTKGNTTRADDIKKMAEAKKATLTALQGNSTLTAFCAGIKDKQTCKAMAGMKRVVAQAANQTFLDKKFKGNQTKIDAFKKKAAKTEEKLKTLEANSTLSDICSKQTQNTSGRGSPASSAPAVQAMGISASILALFTAGVLLL